MTIADIFDQVQSKCLATGLFDQVNMYEPKSPPGTGLTCAVWVQKIGPVPESSGLSMTAGRLEFMIRLYTSMLSEPQDAIDPDLFGATLTLLGIFSGDFELSGAVRNVDLLGSTGTALTGAAGYLNTGGKLMRIIDITLPLIINDLWIQVA